MNESLPPKKLGLPLLIGIIFFPIICVWFTLKKGYSKTSRILSFGYLILGFVFLLALPSLEEIDENGVAQVSDVDQAATPPENKSDFEIVHLDNLSNPERKVWVASVTLDHSLSDQREYYLKQIAEAILKNRGADFVAVRLYPNKYAVDWGFVLGTVEYSPDGLGYDRSKKGDIWNVEINDTYPSEDELNLLSVWYQNRSKFLLANKHTDEVRLVPFVSNELGRTEDWVKSTYADLSEKYGRDNEMVVLKSKEHRRKREAKENFLRQNGITGYYQNDFREFVESITDGRMTIEEGKKLPIKFYGGDDYLLRQLVDEFVIYEYNEELVGRNQNTHRIAVVKDNSRYYGEESELPEADYLCIGVVEFQRTIGGTMQLLAFKEIRY